MSAPKKIYLSNLVMAGAAILDKPVSDDDVEYIRADVIRNEIERLKTVQLKRIQEGDLVDAEPYDKNEAYNELLDFLTTLEPEKPMNLEEEISRYLREECSGDDEPSISEIARHFYDLGCRRTAEKYDELEYNRQRAEEHLATSGKTLEIKPGDEVTINGHKIVYDKDKGYVTIVKSEDSVPNDLEEAAEKYFIKVPCSEEVKKTLIEIYKPGIDAFIAGAKWQAEQLLKSSPLPEDTVLFSKGVEEGKRLMMGEAVEGEVVKDWDNNLSVKSGVICGFKFGEKVRVIVLPKED